jgi:hypothetical protein
MGPQDISTFDVIAELDSGIFKDKVTQALKDAGAAAINTGKASKVILELTFNPVSDSRQAHISHTLKQTIPHKTGNYTDTDNKKTLVHVHSTGEVSIFSEEQGNFDFTPEKDNA